MMERLFFHKKKAEGQASIGERGKSLKKGTNVEETRREKDFRIFSVEIKRKTILPKSGKKARRRLKGGKKKGMRRHQRENQKRKIKFYLTFDIEIETEKRRDPGTNLMSQQKRGRADFLAEDRDGSS